MSEHTSRILAAERLAIVQWVGRVTFEEVVAWLDELVAHPDFSADFDGIVDLRKGDLTGMTPAQVQAVADLMIERRLTRGRWAHLADAPMETALSMMYSRAVSAQYRMRVFSTVESAADFLGRDPAALLCVMG